MRVWLIVIVVVIVLSVTGLGNKLREWWDRNPQVTYCQHYDETTGENAWQACP